LCCVQATPALGFVGTTVAGARFGEINVFNDLIPPEFWKSRHHSQPWLSWQKTRGKSDVYVQSNVWQPGGSTGWHTHPGHSLIIVTQGEVTSYEGDDKACRPTVYTTGMGFVDPGGDHVHNIRNETNAEAKTMAVQLIPADATRRIDVEDPGNCPF
jgi:quercetin dioxygenase-like cupin family protein